MELKEAIQVLENTNYTNFLVAARRIHEFQFQSNHVYRTFIEQTNGPIKPPFSLNDLPFLPIQLFKSQQITAGQFTPEITFYSSATTGKGPSQHHLKSLELYTHSFRKGWGHYYPYPKNLCVLALLPSYLERDGSSLIYMANDMIETSDDPDSGFFLYELERLHNVLLQKIAAGKQTVLLGVSFALLDFAERFQLPNNNLIIMETGGMKGRRKELIREDLHEMLTTKLGVNTIHSEYGMTELLSQAYSPGNGRFHCPPWVKVLVKAHDDPFSEPMVNQRGRLCIIDLANVYSCSFIETEDLGIVYNDGSFEVLGRLDHSDIRGCNTLI